MIICKFGSSDSVNIVNIGSQISFNLSSVPGKDQKSFYGTSYTDSLSCVFQICKSDCKTKGKPTQLSIEEQSHIMRWLNRKDGFYKFKLIQKGYENLYTEASFNLSKIEIAGIVYGFELTMTTLHPYLLEDETELDINTITGEEQNILYDNSDETGYIYPFMTIVCNGNGTLKIKNLFEDRVTQINNCVVGEKITIDGKNQIISTTINEHKIQNDFNYKFFRLANTYSERENIITISLPCSVNMKWSPIRKVGF